MNCLSSMDLAVSLEFGIDGSLTTAAPAAEVLVVLTHLNC